MTQKYPQNSLNPFENFKNKPQSAMEMIDKKAQNAKFKKRKLFDVSDSDQSDNSDEDPEPVHKPVQNKGTKSGVVKRMIYNEPVQKKKAIREERKDTIPKEIEEILNQK